MCKQGLVSNLSDFKIHCDWVVNGSFCLLVSKTVKYTRKSTVLIIAVANEMVVLQNHCLTEQINYKVVINLCSFIMIYYVKTYFKQISLLNIGVMPA